MPINLPARGMALVLPSCSTPRRGLGQNSLPCLPGPMFAKPAPALRTCPMQACVDALQQAPCCPGAPAALDALNKRAAALADTAAAAPHGPQGGQAMALHGAHRPHLGAGMRCGGTAGQQGLPWQGQHCMQRRGGKGHGAAGWAGLGAGPGGFGAGTAVEGRGGRGTLQAEGVEGTGTGRSVVDALCGAMVGRGVALNLPSPLAPKPSSPAAAGAAAGTAAAVLEASRGGSRVEQGGSQGAGAQEAKIVAAEPWASAWPVGLFEEAAASKAEHEPPALSPHGPLGALRPHKVRVTHSCGA